MNLADQYASSYSVAQAPADARTTFYQKTYLHVAAAVGALILFEAFLISTPAISIPLINLMVGGKYSWLVVMALFMGASWIAEKWAHSNTSKGLQYAGLALTVVAYGLVFLPVLFLAMVQMNAPALVGQAGIITGGLVAGLTFVAFSTKKDFSFLGGFLKIAGFIAIGLIAASFFFDGLNLGTWFSGAMILVMGASILYQTSNIIHHYRPDQHVAASLGLFASIATLFFYVLRLLMALRGND